MKTFLSKFEKYQQVIKWIFFITVSIVVVLEIKRLSSTIDFHSLSEILNKISVPTIIGLTALGMISVLPMLYYDVVLNRQIESTYSKSYILETSWAINTINNLVGFAGLVDVGLRFAFYSEENNTEKSMKGISQVVPYFISGFSILSIFGFIITLFKPISGIFQYSNYLLLVPILYLPIILFISSRKNISFFGQLAISDSIKLVVASIAEWIGLFIVFHVIGLALGVAPSILSVFPLFLVAHAIGMASMIPGGIGSFDLIMIAGLAHLGIGNEVAVGWILLFRIFYFIVPFLVGILFFGKHMGKKLNERFLGLPKKIYTLFLSQSSTWLLRLFGSFLILTTLIPEAISKHSWLSRIDPVHAQLLWQFPSVLLGVLFIVLARFVQNRLKISIPFAISLILITLVYINLEVLSIPTTIFLIIVSLSLWQIRSQLSRKQFYYGWEGITKDSLLAVGVLLFILWFGGWNHFHEKIMLKPHLDSIVFSWIHNLVLSLLIIIPVGVLLKLASKNNSEFGDRLDIERYKTFLSKYEGNNDSGLAYLGDKNLYWYQENGEDKVVFQFSVENNKIVVMGDPFGDSAYLEKAIGALLSDAESSNLSVVFYEISKDITLLLHDHGYDFMKFGETSTIDLTKFTTEGKHGKKFRAMMSKFENHGYTFEMIHPPFDNELMERLKEISDAWLGGRQEKGFSLGYFSEEYLQLASIGIVRDQNGVIIAYSNKMPEYSSTSTTIDLMRYDIANSPNGVMDYLFVKLMLEAKNAGYQYFSLGMAPLSNVGQLSHSYIEEKIAFLIYSFTTRFYSFAGLRSYKEKFHPSWSARYIVYPRDTWLIYNLLTILKIDNRKIK
ncbi:TPA: bifunctional lysylphosphatidylglycerol flippase/synthetase MprF [Streptococcus suis]